jgi:hypothetical protein
MGSGLDGWIYWRFFTIEIGYDSPQSMPVYDLLHYLLDFKHLLFHLTNDKWLLTHRTAVKNLWGTMTEEADVINCIVPL